MNRAFYDDFVKRASEGRKKRFEEIDSVAQGRVWTGAEALPHGLVDKLGGFWDAVEVAKQRAGIAKGQDVALVVLPARKGHLRDPDGAAGRGPARGRPAPDLRASLRFVALLRDGAPMARLPFELRVRLAICPGATPGLARRGVVLAVHATKRFVDASGLAHRRKQVVDAAEAVDADQVFHERTARPGRSPARTRCGRTATDVTPAAPRSPKPAGTR
jgi:hypothetical protein